MSSIDNDALSNDGSIATIALFALMAFFSLLILRVAPYFSFLFLSSHGWSHRLAGCIHFCILFAGAVSCCVAMSDSDAIDDDPTSGSKNRIFLFDILLGCSGVVTTLTAAKDFPHKYVQNIPGQSGTLHRTAIVTQSEMIEHSFYQGLNLLQSIYLHLLARCDSKLYSMVALGAVTSPWLLRHKFPVHSFSQNWKSKDVQRSQQKIAEQGEILLYRIKKSQYVFYKHVILHGLNISVALASAKRNPGSIFPIPYGIEWRLFWLLLNMSYVMEFFLQTLVKRNVLTQSNMIGLQRLLMLSASLAAMKVFLAGNTIRIEICALSLLLNFANRHHDVMNTLFIAVLFIVIDGYATEHYSLY